MPTLIVKPLDMTAPGSYAARRKIRQALRETRDAYGRLEQIKAQSAALEKAVAEGNAEAAKGADTFEWETLSLTARITDAVEGLEALVISHCRTDDGSPVEGVLELISAADFDALLAAMMGQAPVPPKSSGS